MQDSLIEAAGFLWLWFQEHHILAQPQGPRPDWSVEGMKTIQRCPEKLGLRGLGSLMVKPQHLGSSACLSNRAEQAGRSPGARRGLEQ